MHNYRPLDDADKDVILGLAECNMCAAQAAKKGISRTVYIMEAHL